VTERRSAKAEASERAIGAAAAAATTAGAWGILGGTFDPIHYAHLAIAERARDALGLTGVLFVPAGSPVHKTHRTVTAPSHRLALVELAIEDDPHFRLSRIETERAGPSYSVDTVEALLADPPDEAAARHGFVFILSAEALAGLHRWRKPQRLLELCRLAVVPRLGVRTPGRDWLAEHFPGQEDRVIFLDGPDLGHSASLIRRLASEGRSIRYLVPPKVEAYIGERALYPPELWAKN
jgi:nicotinate-nucleotide adenylyltransferase